MKRYLLLLLFCYASAAAQPSDVVRAARGVLSGGDAAGAVALLAPLAADTLSPDGFFVLGRAYQELDRHAPAAAALVRADTLDRHVRLALGRSLDELGRTAEAAAAYRAAYQMDTTDAAVVLRLGRLLAEAERWMEVRALFTRLLAVDSTNAAAHAQLAAAYVAMDSVGAAIVHYERAHRQELGNARVALQLSKVYVGAGQLISARRVVDRALEANPRHAKLWHRRGDVALREQVYDLATHCFTQAMALGDSTASDFHKLGVSYYWRARYDSALVALAASDRMDPEQVMNAFYLGMTQQQLGRFDEALATLRRTADLAGQSDLADVHAQIAATLDRLDDPAAAVETYRLALGLAPEKYLLHYHLAALYDRTHADPDVVRAAYEGFLAAVPPEVQTDLQVLARLRLEELNAASAPAVLTLRPDTTAADTTGER